MEEYGIAKIAELFGITAEALRKYELMGLLESKRKSGYYRKYDVWDISALLQIRFYNKYRIPLRKVKELLNHENISETVRVLDEQRENLVREIIYKQTLLRQLDRRRCDLKQVAQGNMGYTIEDSPDLVYASFFETNSLEYAHATKDEKKRKKAKRLFSDFLPFLGTLLIYDPNSWNITDSGYCMEAEFYNACKESEEISLKEMPSCLCVTTILCSRYSRYSDIEPLKLAADEIQRQGYQITGEIFTMDILFDRDKKEEQFCYYRAWFPIHTE